MALNVARVSSTPPAGDLTNEYMKCSIPKRFAPLTYGILQAAVTSAVATTVGTLQSPADSAGMAISWLTNWSLSWLAMVPIVVLVSPLLQRAVLSLVEPLE